MGGIKLQKRDDDFFVSYGHADRRRVAPIVDLLKRSCGLRLWYDGADGNAAVRSSELLGGAIGNARGSLFCLSEAWKRSSWCRSEYEKSLVEQRAHPGFEVVALRLDDVDPPDWFQIAEILDMRLADRPAVARLLRSLASDLPHTFDNRDDVYLAAPWSRPSPLVLDTFGVLRSIGWRLVGDTPDSKIIAEERIAAIQETTRGVVAVLPEDPSEPTWRTSRFILEEAHLAVRLGKPLLLLAEPGVRIPDELRQHAFRGAAIALQPGRDGRDLLLPVLEAFDELLQRSTHDDTRAFLFFAASLRGNAAEADDIQTVIERASNMRCVRGERLSGDNVQLAIIDRIRRAAVVIADVSDDNRNTLIEAGVAMGTRTPLKLICREPPSGAPLKKRFMLEGQEYFWYRTPEEQLALCYYFARQFRRRIYVVR